MKQKKESIKVRFIIKSLEEKHVKKHDILEIITYHSEYQRKIDAM
jgi:hypothetical protein